ncbi:CinA family protein [Nocardia sp. CDC186]|uniref:CinA family protein n=1 Tax=Nocardia implantans TaxID=3108168 RepID=A0ABU6B266_9NOCA|nr:MULTISPECIES: CinA family protein [unclassified Nocardia]MBF6195807.1 CinA family protein [Nocardia beijingensis]MEA3531687.1 CinA family protein [Nocardia sp. CDC192]MEB3513852.1 CinA family protein [Nocardia sp. CDC186]
MPHADDYAHEVAELAGQAEITVAVAESLTAGRLCATLGAAPDSSAWFRGGLVAYSTEVKRTVLGVPDVPVVSRWAAEAMATGVRELLKAVVAVSVTGAGGPDPQDGQPPGSVWFAIATENDVRAWHHQFDGEPKDVLDQTVASASEALLDTVRALHARRSPS